MIGIDEIAKMSITPILNHLSDKARDEMVEDFCKPSCGQSPTGHFCREAELVYRQFLLELFVEYSRGN